VADLTSRMRRLGEIHHLDIRVVGVDHFFSVLCLAQRNNEACSNLPLVQADGRMLPFGDRAVDIAYCATTLHHLDPASAAATLREMGRVARLAVVVTDLRRGWLPWWGARLLLPLLAVTPVTRHDGALSVARAYTAAELRGLAIEAGLKAVRVQRHLGHRLALVGRPPW
jgi:ubiquinone/menaquinone biosynthesis C-methylase UbiE